jgi:hypothetical protein
MKDTRQRDKQIRAYSDREVARQCPACRRWFRAKPRSKDLPLCPRCERAAKEGHGAGR